MLKSILESLKQPSGWRGIILIVGSVAGFQLAPDQVDQIVLACIGVAGAIGAFVKDK